MKKLLAGLMTAALVLTLSAPNALAAPRRHSRAAQCVASGIQAGCIRPACAYVDADGDGVCDNYDPATCPGSGQSNGAGFVDADGDGVCDNYDGTACPGSGQGWNGNGGGQGWGRGHHGGGRHCR